MERSHCRAYIHICSIRIVELTEHQVSGNFLGSTNLVFYLSTIMKMPHRPGYIAQVHTLYSVSTFSTTNEVPFITSERSSFLVLIFCKIYLWLRARCHIPSLSIWNQNFTKWLCGSCPNTGVITPVHDLWYPC